ncbi:MAG: hypothetical protein ACI9W6_000279 [Motiliproteus sp.]|jgi:hypothetical protein
MDLVSLKIDLEKPLYSSLEEIFEKANLNEAEKGVFLRNIKYCEYWLLRSKAGCHQSFSEDTPNFIKRLAAVIYHLESDLVKGEKKKKIKDLFGYGSPIHRVYKTKNGVRSTQNSPTVENTYFELLILSFFIRNGFCIEMLKPRSTGQKNPEFIAIKDGVKISVEAKNLNIDSILDNMHGDVFVDGINHKRSEAEREKGYEKIKKQIQKNYNNAMSKYVDTDISENYIVFMYIYYNNNLIGLPAVSYLNSLQASWDSVNYERFLGLVIPEGERTIYINHLSADHIFLESLDIINFHNYVPHIG